MAKKGLLQHCLLTAPTDGTSDSKSLWGLSSNLYENVGRTNRSKFVFNLHLHPDMYRSFADSRIKHIKWSEKTSFSRVRKIFVKQSWKCVLVAIEWNSKIVCSSHIKCDYVCKAIKILKTASRPGIHTFSSFLLRNSHWDVLYCPLPT